MSRNRLDDYLNRLERPLESLPDDLRAEWREEARHHLTALIAERLADGLAPADAESAAFRRFGDPDRIGQAVYRELRRRAAWRYTHGFSWAIVALVLCVLGTVEISALWIAPIEWAARLLPPEWVGRVFGFLSEGQLFTLCAGGWVGYGLAGILLAARFRRRTPPVWLGLSVSGFAVLADAAFQTMDYLMTAAAGLLVLVAVMNVWVTATGLVTRIVGGFLVRRGAA